MSVIGKRLSLLLVVLVAFTAIRSTAVRAESFESLQAKYLSLRNTDLSLTKAGEWLQVAKGFEAFADKDKGSKEIGQAIFNAGIINEELFRATEKSDYLDHSLQLFESIPRDYPGDDFADDGLLKAGDLQAKLYKNRDEAERRYKELVEAYPESELVVMARARLEDLDKNDNAAANKSRKRDQDEGVQSLPLVIIDPGHGGEDLGAVGGGSLLEKDVVLDVAMRLEALSNLEGFYKVRLTRRSDKFVPLKERTSFANDFEAKLFLSLHVNSNTSPNVSGIETYYLDNTNDRSSQKLAERENQYFSEQEELGDLNFILSDLIQSAKLGDSIALANIVQRNLIKRMTAQWGKQHDLGVKKAPFYVLVGVHIPCVLTELYFINNRQDEIRLADPQFRQALADGLNLGIKEYLKR